MSFRELKEFPYNHDSRDDAGDHFVFLCEHALYSIALRAQSDRRHSSLQLVKRVEWPHEKCSFSFATPRDYTASTGHAYPSLAQFCVFGTGPPLRRLFYIDFGGADAEHPLLRPVDGLSNSSRIAMATPSHLISVDMATQKQCAIDFRSGNVQQIPRQPHSAAAAAAAPASTVGIVQHSTPPSTTVSPPFAGALESKHVRSSPPREPTVTSELSGDLNTAPSACIQRVLYPIDVYVGDEHAPFITNSSAYEDTRQCVSAEMLPEGHSIVRETLVGSSGPRCRYLLPELVSIVLAYLSTPGTRSFVLVELARRHPIVAALPDSDNVQNELKRSDGAADHENTPTTTTATTQSASAAAAASSSAAVAASAAAASEPHSDDAIVTDVALLDGSLNGATVVTFSPYSLHYLHTCFQYRAAGVLGGMRAGLAALYDRDGGAQRLGSKKALIEHFLRFFSVSFVNAIDLSGMWCVMQFDTQNRDDPGVLVRFNERHGVDYTRQLRSPLEASPAGVRTADGSRCWFSESPLSAERAVHRQSRPRYSPARYLFVQMRRQIVEERQQPPQQPPPQQQWPNASAMSPVVRIDLLAVEERAIRERVKREKMLAARDAESKSNSTVDNSVTDEDTAQPAIVHLDATSEEALREERAFPLESELHVHASYVVLNPFAQRLQWTCMRHTRLAMEAAAVKLLRAHFASVRERCAASAAAVPGYLSWAEAEQPQLMTFSHDLTRVALLCARSGVMSLLWRTEQLFVCDLESKRVWPVENSSNVMLSNASVFHSDLRGLFVPPQNRPPTRTDRTYREACHELFGVQALSNEQLLATAVKHADMPHWGPMVRLRIGPCVLL